MSQNLRWNVGLFSSGPLHDKGVLFFSWILIPQLWFRFVGFPSPINDIYTVPSFFSLICLLGDLSACHGRRHSMSGRSHMFLLVWITHSTVGSLWRTNRTVSVLVPYASFKSYSSFAWRESNYCACLLKLGAADMSYGVVVEFQSSQFTVLNFVTEIWLKSMY